MKRSGCDKLNFSILATPKQTKIHPIPRHPHEGGNPQFPRTREFTVPIPQCPKKHSAIPSHAGIHRPITPNARKNTPSFPRTRESNPPAHQPSFPRRRESTIPAHAGIHRPNPPMPEKTLRHSLARGNPPSHYPQCPKKHSVIPAHAGIQPTSPPAVIPAKAGIHNSRARGNSSSHYPQCPKKNTPSFPRRPGGLVGWIPACAGMTECFFGHWG